MLDWIYESELIKYMFCSNYWVWFHILAGGLLARLMMRSMTDYLDRWVDIVTTVLVLAVFFEVFEVLVLEGGLNGVQIIYGSIRHWIMDMGGDVLGAVLCAAIVSYKQ